MLIWIALLVGQMTQGNPCLVQFNWTWFHCFLLGPDEQSIGADLTNDNRTDLRDVALFQNLFADGWITFVK